MKGFSIRKDKWLTFLVIGTVILLILPILAGAQTGAEEPSEESTPAVEEGTTETPEEAVAEPTDMETAEEEPAEQPEEAPPAEAQPVEVIKYHYFILHSLEPDLPIEEWDIVARFPVDQNFTYEQPGYFGFFAEDPNPEEPSIPMPLQPLVPIKPIEPAEPGKPAEPIKPVKSDYPDAPKKYKKVLQKYDEDLQRYNKDMQKIKDNPQKYDEDLQKYDQDMQELNEHLGEYRKDLLKTTLDMLKYNERLIGYGDDFQKYHEDLATYKEELKWYKDKLKQYQEIQKEYKNNLKAYNKSLIKNANALEKYKTDLAEYIEKVEEYRETVREYEKDIKGYENYLVKYPQLLEKYEDELETFNENVYPELEHYYFFEKDIPDPNRKIAIYKMTITQPVISPEEPEPAETPAETAPEDQAMVPDEPASIISPPEPKLDDLVLPEKFWLADRANDTGGTIALRWDTTSADKITTTYIPEEVTLPEVSEEPAAPAKPEYNLNKFVVDAWVFAVTEDDKKERKVVLVDPKNLTVNINLSPLGGEKDSQLEFVGIVDKLDGKGQKVYDYGLGAHFRGTFTIEEPNIGKFLIEAEATIAGSKKKLHGKVKVKKIVSEPVDAKKTEDALPDNRYKHYFKLGMDLWNHEGHPRWIIEQDPPLGLVANSNMLNRAKWNTLLYSILIAVALLYFILRARKGAALFVRRIAGLDHIEEAIGRATEMGKPILYVPGIGTMADVATIAAMNILGQVTRKVAEYDSRIVVPNKDPIVMTVAQETVQEAYIDAGHPDKFNKDDVFFLTDDQFAFAAAVDGIMVRDKPATILFMGMFYAESLILAETGAGTGAIQIAGTDALHQLPFFVTACDYTLIGEELYAASAYLSREPLLLGSLKGQDMAKLIIIILVFVGVILATFGIEALTKLFSSPL